MRLIEFCIDSLFFFSIIFMAQKNSKVSGATTAGPIDNADMFLKRGLEKLLSDKDIKKSQYQQIKRACESALGLFDFIISSLLNFLFQFPSQKIIKITISMKPIFFHLN